MKRSTSRSARVHRRPVLRGVSITEELLCLVPGMRTRAWFCEHALCTTLYRRVQRERRKRVMARYRRTGRRPGR